MDNGLLVQNCQPSNTKQRLINVETMSVGCFNIEYMLYQPYMPAGK